MITKVFPDEYHFHTLDQILSAIARLNPHVDLKKIVIGLMDRLSSFAQRQNDEGVSAEDGEKAEEEAISQLLEKVKLSKEAARESSDKVNGAEPSSEAKGKMAEVQPEQPKESGKEPSSTEPEAEKGPSNDSKNGILAEVKLYEIFYDQVVSLVRTRGLSIQDTMALLTSLVNLAL